jgi:hypothetical protein
VVTAEPSIIPTLPPPTVPPPIVSPTIEVPPPIDEPPPPTDPPTTAAPTQSAAATPTRTPVPSATAQPAGNAPVLEGGCLTYSNQPTGEFARSLIVDLSFEDGNLDGVEIGISNANGGQPAEGSAVLPGLWQVWLGVTGQRLPAGTQFNLANVENARGQVHDVLPQVAGAIGDIPSNFNPGDSVGDLCGGFGDPF